MVTTIANSCASLAVVRATERHALLCREASTGVLERLSSVYGVCTATQTCVGCCSRAFWACVERVVRAQVCQDNAVMAAEYEEPVVIENATGGHEIPNSQ